MTAASARDWGRLAAVWGQMNERLLPAIGKGDANGCMWVNRIGSAMEASALVKLLRVEAAVVSFPRGPLIVLSATVQDKPEAGAPEASGTA